MNKIAKNKNQILEVLNRLAAKRFSNNEKIALIIIFIIIGLIGNYYFNNWIAALKSKNSVVIPISPPIIPKLPDPLIIKPVKFEEPIFPEINTPTLRDPFLSSKNPQELKTIVTKKPSVELKLSGILWDDKIPSAIINSSIVKIGDLIEGKTVVDIEKNQVVVMEDGKILILELRKQ
ncbi:MAG: hypothetical protein V1747_10045 [Candidatus Omnitrophota bacterium]